MKKIIAFLAIILIFALLQNKNNLQAYADQNIHKTSIDVAKNVFNGFENGKNKYQIRVFGNNFMIKGQISAASSTSITINSQVIYIDPSVTGDVKVVGNPQVNAYAIISGIIQNSDYYAQRIVINQRDKNEPSENEQGEENENVTPTVTPTVIPTVTLTPTPTPIATESPTLTPTPVSTQSASIETNFGNQFNLQNIINNFEKFFSFVNNGFFRF